jgi:hypothetical protein
MVKTSVFVEGLAGIIGGDKKTTKMFQPAGFFKLNGRLG